MKVSTRILVLGIAASSCFVFSVCSKIKEPVVERTPAVNNDVLLAQKREDDAASKTYDELGKLVATVDFNLWPSKEDLAKGESDPIPWISLGKIDEELGRMIAADEVVVPYKKVTIMIDYPLNKPAFFDLVSENGGFSRKQLAIAISKKYHALYIEEEETALRKTIPPEQRKGMINRNETDGKYGIWGHDLSDLVLSTVEVRRNPDGKIVLALVINS